MNRAPARKIEVSKQLVSQESGGMIEDDFIQILSLYALQNHVLCESIRAFATIMLDASRLQFMQYYGMISQKQTICSKTT